MDQAQIRNRIKEYKLIKAKDLLPNPKNWRTHSKEQKEVLSSVLQEIGYANTALVWQPKKNKYMLIDGHLRQEEADPEQEIPVLVLDVNAEEADKLLAIIDPLAGMAGKDAAKLKEILQDIETGDEVLLGFFTQQAEEAGVEGDGELDSVETGGEKKAAGLKEGEELPQSNVRMFQLFMTTETWPDFQKNVKYLAERLKAENPTDCVMKALARLVKIFRKEEKHEKVEA